VFEKTSAQKKQSYDLTRKYFANGRIFARKKKLKTLRKPSNELVRTAVLQQYQRQSSANEKKLQASDPNSTTNQKGFEVSFIPGRRVLGERCVSLLGSHCS
jgi:hypothetical protein